MIKILDLSQNLSENKKRFEDSVSRLESDEQNAKTTLQQELDEMAIINSTLKSEMADLNLQMDKLSSEKDELIAQTFFNLLLLHFQFIY
jgi:chromosome segregation ATPase